MKPSKRDQLSEHLYQIRGLGSLLISTGLASEEYEDWSAVAIAGRIVVEHAESLLELLDEIEEAADGQSTQETSS